MSSIMVLAVFRAFTPRRLQRYCVDIDSGGVRAAAMSERVVQQQLLRERLTMHVTLPNADQARKLVCGLS